jgi:hypothetical protein
MNTHKFSELRARMSPEARAESERLLKEAVEEIEGASRRPSVHGKRQSKAVEPLPALPRAVKAGLGQ